MSGQKRGRACEACSKIKTRCSLGNDPDAAPPCERCYRLHRDCVLPKPQRQKDRVQELEAQVAALTRLLQQQGIEDPAVPVSTMTDTSLTDGTQEVEVSLQRSLAAQKKRKLDVQATSAEILKHESTSDVLSKVQDGELQQLDGILSRALQETCLRRYIEDYAPAFPLVPIRDDCSFEAMRQERPILLHAAVYAASATLLSEDLQDELCTSLLDKFARKVVVEGERSFEMLQALLIATLHARTAGSKRFLATTQLIQFADELTVDLGIGDPSMTRFNLFQAADPRRIDPIDASLAVLACHLLSSAMSYLLRRSKTSTWTSFKETCLILLSCDSDDRTRNEWIAQYVRCERLCERVVDEMRLCEPDWVCDVADQSYRTRLARCNDMISEWETSASPISNAPALQMWKHVAIAYAHEPVLHTLTNKQSFAAPFVADRLSTADFPCPAVTDAHVESLNALIAALHAIIDLFTGMDPKLVVLLPALLYTSRVLYAAYVLVKTHAALTSPGNTFGAFVDARTLKVESYLEKMTSLFAQVDAIGARCGPTRIMSASVRLQRWFLTYQSTIAGGRSTDHACEALSLSSDVLSLNLLPEMSSESETIEPSLPTSDFPLLDFDFDAFYALTEAEASTAAA